MAGVYVTLGISNESQQEGRVKNMRRMKEKIQDMCLYGVSLVAAITFFQEVVRWLMYV